jgi:hypothetical protein
VVRARLIGALEAEQKENGSWIRNDRLIAVAVHAQTYQHAKSLADLRPHLVKEITEFFFTYNKLRDRKFKCLGKAGPKEAGKIVDRGLQKFRKKRKKAALNLSEGEQRRGECVCRAPAQGTPRWRAYPDRVLGTFKDQAARRLSRKQGH